MFFEVANGHGLPHDPFKALVAPRPGGDSGDDPQDRRWPTTKVTSIHHAHQPEIEIFSADTAKGIWVLEDRFWWMNGDVEEHFHGFGHYHETYHCVHGRWLIASRTVTRTRVTHTPNYYSYYDRV